jgi:hypothetical protein
MKLKISYGRTFIYKYIRKHKQIEETGKTQMRKLFRQNFKNSGLKKKHFHRHKNNIGLPYIIDSIKELTQLLGISIGVNRNDIYVVHRD